MSTEVDGLSGSGATTQPSGEDEPTRVWQASVLEKLQRAEELEDEAKRARPAGRAGGEAPDGDSSESSDAEQDTRTALEAQKLRIQTLKAENRQQDIRLRKRLAYWAIAFVGAQLVASNIFFGVYIFSNRADASSQVMTAWLAASVIEVIGILLVIARSLFPVKGGNGGGSAAKAE